MKPAARIKRGRKRGSHPCGGAVNVSAVQFTKTDFVKTVHDALETSGLDPIWLETEITESNAVLHASLLAIFT